MMTRKKIIFNEEKVQNLKEIEERENTTQTQAVKELIEEKYDEISVEEKLEALYAFAGSGTGLYGDLTMQEIKANKDV
ncbi:MAG: hypothetical protein H8E76_10510 [Helicobacteraceae bacterium]|nr:hypothetical protein [Candidatus Sulfurimonas ponti]